MSEERRILEMIEQGHISSAEGLELLNALRDTKKEEVYISEPSVKKEYRFLKIKIVAENGETKVNVNIPLKLIKALGGLVPQLGNMIPEDAKTEMSSKGIDLGNLDIGKLLEALEEGEFEDGTLVDIEVNDPDDGKVQVKIYVE